MTSAYTEIGALRIACVGRLDPRARGQDILLEALSGPLWAARPWLADRVIFAGQLKLKEIWSLCHVSILPSRYEGLPLTIIEAMLCGRPVFATDVGGNTEVVEDDVTGFIANAPTVASLSPRHNDAITSPRPISGLPKTLSSDPPCDFGKLVG